MAMKSKLSLAIFLFFLLALFSNLAMGTEESEVEDPELKTCKHQCKQQLQYSEEDKQICMQKCDKYEKMKQEGETQHEREEKGSGHHHHHEEEKQNPYVFEEQHFDTSVETDDGRIRVLRKFTKLSDFLEGIENFRLAIFEAKGHSFVSPRHFDSEAVFFNIRGQAIIGLVREDKTERFNLQPGDLMRISPGTPFYIVNRDENEKLLLAVFHIPISTPGKFEEFYGPGGRDPESVLTAFSWDVLQAALKTPKRRLERLFDQQNEGSIFKISREHVQAMAPKRSIWSFGSQKGPFNLFTKSPSFSNQYGRQSEVDSSDEKSGLKGLNLKLTFANITMGSMSTLYYNSHATKIGFIIDGEGCLEMACPHVSSKSHSEHGKSSPSYQHISANLRPGMVFVVPAGHPFVTIASKRNHLLIICFEVNAEGNMKLTFAGKNNIVSALDKTAKELAFNYPAEKVDEIFSRKEQLFFPFEEEESEEHDRADA